MVKPVHDFDYHEHHNIERPKLYYDGDEMFDEQGRQVVAGNYRDNSETYAEVVRRVRPDYGMASQSKQASDKSFYADVLNAQTPYRPPPPERPRSHTDPIERAAARMPKEDLRAAHRGREREQQRALAISAIEPEFKVSFWLDVFPYLLSSLLLGAFLVYMATYNDQVVTHVHKAFNHNLQSYHALINQLTQLMHQAHHP